MTNKMERFTQSSRRVLSVSQELAEQFKSQLITPEFMLLAMTHLEGTVAFHVLANFDIIRSKLQPHLVKTIFLEFAYMFDPIPQIDLADTTKKVLELSVDSSRKLGLDYIGTENLLIGIMYLESENIDTILAHFDVQRKDVIKLAESYATKADDTLEEQINTEPTVYPAQARNTSGLRRGKNLESFTPIARQTVTVAEELAKVLKIKLITTELLLLALASIEDSDAFNALDDCDIIASKLRPFLETTVFPKLEKSDSDSYQLDLTADVRKVLELSVDSARRQGVYYISTAHLLIGMMRLNRENINTILAHFDVKRQDVIELADAHARKSDTPEKDLWRTQIAKRKNVGRAGCFASLLDLFGLSNE